MKVALKYFAIFLCICAFGLFVYPGMYKYDKFNQNLPVMINRITGETKILTAEGWEKMTDSDVAEDKMNEYKQEISNQIASQNEDIKQEVLLEVQSQLEQIASEVVAKNTDTLSDSDVTADISQNIIEGFSEGDSQQTVKEIMGVPDSKTEVGPYDTWRYGLSMVKFKDGKVNGWDNQGNNLLIE